MNVAGVLSMLNDVEELIDKDPSTAKIKLRKVIDLLGWDEKFWTIDDADMAEQDKK